MVDGRRHSGEVFCVSTTSTQLMERCGLTAAETALPARKRDIEKWEGLKRRCVDKVYADFTENVVWEKNRVL